MPQISSSNTTNSNSSSTSTAIGWTVLATSTITLTCAYFHHNRTMQRLERKLTDARLAERRGRIRAEVSLRTHLKELEQTKLLSDSNHNNHTTTTSTTNNNKNKTNDKNNNNNPKMLLQCLGTLTTPFTKRMGTPRQGALVPASRAFLELDTKYAMELFDGIQDYSHCWIVFQFHANTNNLASEEHKKSKIKPPRAQGEGQGKNFKVGMLATRSPHRPNPLGLSLVKVGQVDRKKRRLYFEAIDLVHGTPVYDIKPCVPWDIPGHHDKVPLRVPSWVEQDDALPTVLFAEEAKTSLYKLMSPPHNALAPLYTFSKKKKKNNNKSKPSSLHSSSSPSLEEEKEEEQNDFIAAQHTIQQVLAQDPRSTYKRGTQTDQLYSFVFGKLTVEFQMGDLSKVMIVHVKLADLENAMYVDGIPLLSEAEK